mmetsp:Transcript_46334/g.61341  ORF Transcript_46334/g.61341 Transcript_46334/m.61341 type:complete len:100 (+) Transcript_46334:250-549(+)|eukprot:CAMPEP_0170467070 /NCGR_PEP_ID=MMETSP0123-20130129/10786_1 /TAXON_ID=182087 /ORGANISM="Favella ehrenbergii, Strain Fehren 1" /LENGTH=99 /DNA_ID=CAMNT_0010733343 /DNA_START=190 /DNA_END=489 /DNA_ORIENTATION=+
MSRLQKAKHEEELRKKATMHRTIDEEEELEELGKANEEKLQEEKQQDDLLACHKCKQFGHLSFQCMNMFSKDGKKATLSDRTLLTQSTATAASNADEEA